MICVALTAETSGLMVTALRFSLHKVSCCLSPLSYWLLSPGFFLSLFIKMWFSAQCFPAVIDNRS